MTFLLSKMQKTIKITYETIRDIEFSSLSVYPHHSYLKFILYTKQIIVRNVTVSTHFHNFNTILCEELKGMIYFL